MSDVWRTVGESLGADVVSRSPVSGGDINDAFRVDLRDGRRVFVKLNQSAPADMFEAEARGLAWLAEAEALRVPRVLAVGARFLVLEFLAPGRRARTFDERLGAGLATVHRAGASGPGLGYDNYLATLPQRNEPRVTWSDFYAHQRLEPLVRRAIDRGLGRASWADDFARLFARLPDLVDDDEPAARLHGDLWSGNIHCDEDGNPCLIDPAVYGGHREIDLAMLELFGQPGERFYAGYESVWPLGADWRRRVPLYQLYPLLAHVNLFGSSYTAQTERALRQYL